MQSKHPYYISISIAVFITSGLWGLYWIPQRALQNGGLTGGWGTVFQYAIPLIVLTPFIIWKSIKGRRTGLHLPLIGIFFGGGIACYANSFLLTDIMRVFILFYFEFFNFSYFFKLEMFCIYFLKFLLFSITNIEKNITIAHAPLGAPGTVMFLEDLITCGAQKIIGLGAAGTLSKGFKIGDLLIPYLCKIVDEGTSQHYKTNEKIEPNPKLYKELIDNKIVLPNIIWNFL